MQSPEPGAVDSGRPRRYTLTMVAVTACMAIAALAYGLYWWRHARHYETTDNAYVGGDIVPITVQLSGTLMSIQADDNDFVQAGQQVATLDPSIPRIKLERAEADLAKIVRQTRPSVAAAGTPSAVTQSPDILAAAARVKEAFLELGHTEVDTPISGYVVRRTAQVGQRVGEGSVLMSVVSLDRVWVEANFKEDQLASLRIGQPVELVCDLYGSDLRFSGKITGLAAATGSALSPLPSRNALGSWVKVVQRLPVRIAIDAADIAKHPLRIGLSMRVAVDVRSQEGEVLSRKAVGQQPSPTRMDAAQRLYLADQHVERIIRDNAGVARTAAGPASVPSLAASSEPIRD